MKNLAEFFEREGGQIILLAVMVIVFACLAFVCQSNSAFFDKIATAGFGTFLGALIMVMKGNGNGKAASAVVPPAPVATPIESQATKQ
jgi:hypothetical protein